MQYDRETSSQTDETVVFHHRYPPTEHHPRGQSTEPLLSGRGSSVDPSGISRVLVDHDHACRREPVISERLDHAHRLLRLRDWGCSGALLLRAYCRSGSSRYPDCCQHHHPRPTPCEGGVFLIDDGAAVKIVEISYLRVYMFKRARYVASRHVGGHEQVLDEAMLTLRHTDMFSFSSAVVRS